MKEILLVLTLVFLGLTSNASELTKIRVKHIQEEEGPVYLFPEDPLDPEYTQQRFLALEPKEYKGISIYMKIIKGFEGSLGKKEEYTFYFNEITLETALKEGESLFLLGYWNFTALDMELHNQSLELTPFAGAHGVAQL